MAVDSLSERAAAENPRRSRWVWRLAPIALWLLIAAIMGLLASGITTPRRFQDEFLYWGLAHSLAAGRGLTWYGGDYPVISSFYPIVLSLAVAATDTVSSQFELIKQVNALLMSAVVFPVYLAARWFVQPPLALVAALMAALVPAMNYVGMIGTEVIAYPLAAAALVALVRAIGRPSTRATLEFAVFLALAAFSRIQFVSLLPTALVAAGLTVVLAAPDERRTRFVALKSLWLFLAVTLFVGLLYGVARGNSSVGIYLLVLRPIRIEWHDIDYWLRAFSADLYILCAFVPAIATFALLGRDARKGDPMVSALALVAVVASVIFVMQMTWFTAIGFEHARERHILYERYLFYLGPLYFVGLVAALKRASTRAVLISTAVAVVLVLLLPTEAILIPISQDSFSQAYLGFMLDEHPRLLAWSPAVLAAFALVLGGLLALIRRGDPERATARYARMGVLIVPIFLMLITQMKAWSYQQIYADGVRNASPQPLSWVSDATDRPAAQLVAEGTDRLGFFLTGFWNLNVDRLYVSPEAPIGSYMVTAPTCELRWSREGRILPTAAQGCAAPPMAWVLESPTLVMRMRDERARTSPRRTPTSTLMLTDEPPQLFSLLGGRTVRTGEVQRALVLRSFLRGSGALRLRLTSKGATTMLRLPGGAKVTIKSGAPTTLVLKLRGGDQLTRIERIVGPGKLYARAVELREGAGAWQAID